MFMNLLEHLAFPVLLGNSLYYMPNADPRPQVYFYNSHINIIPFESSVLDLYNNCTVSVAQGFRMLSA